MKHPTIKRLRWLGYAEAFSWLVLLLIAMPLKYIWHQPMAVKYVGWVHGILFIFYNIYLLMAARLLNWPLKKLITGGIGAFFPFGTLWFDKRI